MSLPWLSDPRRPLTNPRSLPNLSAWYDASDGASTTSDYLRIGGSNNVSLIADKSGNSTQNCLLLPGVAGNYASFTALTAFGTGGFSVSAKIMVPSVAADGAVIGGAAASFSLRIQTGTLKLVSAKSGTGNNTVSASAITLFQECVVGYTRSGTTGTYYLNGVAIGTTTDSQNYTVGVSEIGSVSAGTGVLLTANLKWSRVYSAALDATAMAADAAGTVQANCVLNIDWTSYAKLAASPVTAATGQTVTINQTAIALPARIHGERDLYQGLAASQPVYLPYAGTKYGYLNGASGNYFSTPDSVPLSITGDIDIVVCANLVDWTPASSVRLLSKFIGATNQRSYLLSIVPGGLVSLGLSYNGTAFTAYNSTAAVSFTDGTIGWVRAKRIGSDVTIYTSADGVTWSQLGNVVAAVNTALYDSTAALEVGSTEGGSSGVVSGRIYRAQVWSGDSTSGGTLAFDFNPATYTSGTTFTDSSSNAATITLNGGAHIVTRTCIYFDGTADYMKTAAFSYSQPESVYFVGSQVSWTDTDNIIDGSTNTMRLYQRTTTPSVQLFANAAAAANTGWTLKTGAIVTAIFNGASSLLRINRSAATTGDPGPANANGLTVSALGDGTLPGNTAMSELICRSAADATATQDMVVGYASRKWGISLS